MENNYIKLDCNIYDELIISKERIINDYKKLENKYYDLLVTVKDFLEGHATIEDLRKLL